MKIKLFFIGLLIIPQFKLNINGSDFTYPDINLGVFNPASTLGELKKGPGIYSTKEYTAEIDFSADSFLSSQEKKVTFEKILATIDKRVDYSYLYDIKTTGQITDDHFYIKFAIPQHYSDPEVLVSLLTGAGEISFTNDPQVSNATVNLTDKDIKGLLKVGYDDLQKLNFIEFKFSDSKVSEFTSAISNSQRYFLMTVDGYYWAVTGNQYLPQVVNAYPFSNALPSTNILVYENIVNTYFLDQPLDHQVRLDSTKTIELPRNYIQDSVTFLSIVFILSAIGLTLFFYISYGINKTAKFALMLSSFVVFFVFILKLQAAILSINMLTGLLVAYLIATIVIWSLVKLPSDEADSALIKFRNLSIALLFIMLGVYKLVPNLDTLLDFFGSIMTGIIALFVMTILNFKFISQLEININLRKLLRR